MSNFCSLSPPLPFLPPPSPSSTHSLSPSFCFSSPSLPPPLSLSLSLSLSLPLSLSFPLSFAHSLFLSQSSPSLSLRNIFTGQLNTPDGSVQASQSDEPLLNPNTDHFAIQLQCGRFTFRGDLPYLAEWTVSTLLYLLLPGCLS